MTPTTVSFAQFFHLAPALLELDRDLDAVGCPVPYRKYIGATLLANSTLSTESVRRLSEMLSEAELAPAPILSAWYNNVYGHVVYQPPASRFVAAAVPVPVVVTWDASATSVTLPDVTLIQFAVQKILAGALRPDGPLLVGLKELQSLPVAPWIWLAMADFDVSVACFEHPRPAYHLSLWHSQQTLEKLLKAVLLAHGETEKQVREYGHDASKILDALASHAVTLSTAGATLFPSVFALVGGPSVRYLDDSPDPVTRLDLARRALRAHHMVLSFLAADGNTLGACLAAGTGKPHLLGVDIAAGTTDEELRKAVHLEHQSMCSHTLYTALPYAIPERRDVDLQLTGIDGRNAG